MSRGILETKIVLQEGEYTIPPGYTIKKVGGVIRVYKSASKCLGPNDHRCKDCAHYVEGYSLNSGWYKTKVCELQPKRPSKDGKRMLYKAAKKYGKPCDKFELKKND